VDRIKTVLECMLYSLWQAYSSDIEIVTNPYYGANTIDIFIAIDSLCEDFKVTKKELATCNWFYEAVWEHVGKQWEETRK